MIAGVAEPRIGINVPRFFSSQMVGPGKLGMKLCGCVRMLMRLRDEHMDDVLQHCLNCVRYCTCIHLGDSTDWEI